MKKLLGGIVDKLIDKPKNAYAKAQNICEDRLDSAAPTG